MRVRSNVCARLCMRAGILYGNSAEVVRAHLKEIPDGGGVVPKHQHMCGTACVFFAHALTPGVVLRTRTKAAREKVCESSDARRVLE